MRQLPHMNELQEKYGGKGLQILGLYSQAHPLEEVRKLVADRSIKYPQAYWWHDDDNLYNNLRLPMCWLVGADGRIKFIGKDGYDKVLEEELAKVKYAGLGDLKIVAGLERAANAYAAMDYMQALKLARAESEKEGASEAAQKCADALIQRVEERFKELRRRAENAEIEGDWRLAIATWEVISRRFESHDDAADVPAHLKRLKEDKKLPREIEAHEAYQVLTRTLTYKRAGLKECIAEYDKLAEKHAKTEVSRRAAELAETMRQQLKEEREKKEKESEKKDK
jgi:hypothetical protein